MTAINIALSASEALIVCDERISGGTGPDTTSKVLALPHLGAVVALTGHACLLPPTVAAMLLHARGPDIRDALTWLPEMLREAAAREGLLHPTSVYLVGTIDFDVCGYVLASSADFEPASLAQHRAHLNPAPGFLAPQATAPAPEAGALAGLRRPDADEPASDWQPDFATLRAIVREAVPVQRREHPATVGGRLVQTTVRAWSLHTTWDDDPA